jgi:hypothetical protein
MRVKSIFRSLLTETALIFRKLPFYPDEPHVIAVTSFSDSKYKIECLSHRELSLLLPRFKVTQCTSKSHDGCNPSSVNAHMSPITLFQPQRRILVQPGSQQ